MVLRYAGYVDELLAFSKPSNAEEEHDFTCLLASILCDHTSVPRALAAGTCQLAYEPRRQRL